MKWVKRIALVLILVVLGLAALQYLASETTGEVIVLTTTDSNGESQETRLWIVDSGGEPWLRAGQDAAGWYGRILQNPTVQLTRDGTTATYTAVPNAAATDTINGLMREKYTWGETVISIFFDRSSSIAIRLDKH